MEHKIINQVKLLERSILYIKLLKISFSVNQGKWATYLTSKEILHWREKIYNNPHEFLNLCKHYDCCPDIWALNIWNNWVTPPSFKARFNTMFFLTTFNHLPSAFSDEKEVQNILVIRLKMVIYLKKK